MLFFSACGRREGSGKSAAVPQEDISGERTENTGSSGIPIRIFHSDDSKENLCVSMARTEEITPEILLLNLSFYQMVPDTMTAQDFERKKQEDGLLLTLDLPEDFEEYLSGLDASEEACFYGMADPKMVPAFYQMADLFVCASTSETQGLTYVEALASGLPLVCRRDPCLAGVLDQGKNGYSYRTREEFGSYVKELVCKQEVRERMSAHSRELAKAFGTEAFGRAVDSLYKKEVRRHEGAFVFEESETAFTEWNWTGYADAKRFP